MYAVVAETSVAPGAQDAHRHYFAEVAALSAERPGFHGALRVDAGAGRQLDFGVWETWDAWQAGQPVLESYRARMGLAPVASRAVLGMGAVLFNTLTAGEIPSCAIISEITYAPGQWDAGRAQTEEYFALRAQQPGYRGTLGIDVGAERRLMLICWESEAQFAASRSVLIPAAARLVAPLFAAPPRHIGDGTVAYDSLTSRP